MNKTMEQQRASHALKKIVEKGKAKDDLGDKYKSYVSALPATILQNGLGQAMAAELAAGKGKGKGKGKDKDKGKDAHQTLYNHLQDWLCAVDHPNSPYFPSKNLMEAIVENDQEKYIQAQAEAMAYLEWLKKFAVAYIKD